jgi:lysozyme
MPKLTIKTSTTLKSGTGEASTLPDTEKHFVEADKTFELDAYVLEDGHIKFTLAKNGSCPMIKGRNTWFVFGGHARVGERDGIAPSQFRPNRIGIKIIQHFEGLELKQYYCPAGFSTIGYGATVFTDGGDVPVGAIITEEIALQLLQRDLMRFVGSLRSLVKVPLTGRQVGALTSFVYNLGSGALAESTLLQLLNDGEEREVVADQFLRWDKADGVPLAGLTARREAEKDLWLGVEPVLR